MAKIQYGVKPDIFKICHSHHRCAQPLDELYHLREKGDQCGVYRDEHLPIRRLSPGIGTARSMSLTIMLVETLAPPSRHTLATTLSTAKPRRTRTPD